MDIPAHILDAVQTSDSASQRRLEVGSIDSRRSPNTSRFPGALFDAHSSAEDVSTTSDSIHDYQTDFTTPAQSDSSSSPDDMQPDDVEDFRDREYPQLKGKTYLDHGGTTVRPVIGFASHHTTNFTPSCTPNPSSKSSQQTSSRTSMAILTPRQHPPQLLVTASTKSAIGHCASSMQTPRSSTSYSWPMPLPPSRWSSIASKTTLPLATPPCGTGITATHTPRSLAYGSQQRCIVVSRVTRKWIFG